MQKFLSSILFALSFGVVVFFHVYSYAGHYGFDDMEYAMQANNILHGATEFTNHFSYRSGLVLPTVLSYKLFGVNDFASSLPAITASFLSLLILYLMLRTKRPRIQLIAYSLFIFNRWTLYYTDKLMPDSVVTLAVLWMIYILYKQRIVHTFGKSGWYGFLFSVALYFGAITKENIILLAPMGLYLLAVDIIKKQNLRFWVSTLVSTLVLTVIYLSIIKYLSGNFWERFVALEKGSYFNSCSYSQLPFSYLIERLTSGFWLMLINSEMIFGLVFFASIMRLSWLRNPDVHERTFFYCVSFLLFLSSQFLTVTYKGYNPMCLDPRHYLFIIPIVALAVSSDVFLFFTTRRQWFRVLCVWMFVALVIIFQTHRFEYSLYHPFIALVLLRILVKSSQRWIGYAFSLAFVVVAGYSNWQMFAYYHKLNFTAQQQDVQSLLSRVPQHSIVVSDIVQCNLDEYYTGLHKKSRLKPFDYELDKSDTSVYLLYNFHTFSLANCTVNELPEFYKFSMNASKPFDEQNQIKLYRVQKLPNFKLIFSSIYTAEDTGHNWSCNPAFVSNKLCHRGSYANRVGEYSATLTQKLVMPADTELLIKFRASLFYNSLAIPSKAVVAVSADDGNGQFIWLSAPMAKGFRPSVWLNVTSTQFFRLHFKANIPIVLKAYVCNPSKQYMLIDDFEVELSAAKCAD